MTPEDHEDALDALQRMCLGSVVIEDSDDFGVTLVLIDPNESAPRFRQRVHLVLETLWRVFPSRPKAFPRSEEELPEMGEEEQRRKILELCNATVSLVELGIEAPHLTLTFDDGRVMFVNGWDERYELWHLSSAAVGILEGGKVVACPHGEVAVWTPPQ